ncbi:MAG: chromate efflux transporter, partial [Ktedonobacterales bacterium]
MSDEATTTDKATTETTETNLTLADDGAGRPDSLGEVAALFLRLGFTAFGGPAAHIAMMREEVVRRRRWISDQRFLDLIGVINLIPGPNSTELAIYLGYLRAGWLGLIIAGVCFIGPAMLIVLSLAWAYVTFGSTPQVGWLLYGIKPVIIAIIVQAIWGLSRTALRSVTPVIVALAILALYLLGVNELALLFGGALAFGLIRYGQHLARNRRRRGSGGAVPAASLLLTPAALVAAMREVIGRMAQATRNALTSMRTLGATATAIITTLATGATVYDPLMLFLTFLKIGAVLYGSGYVILAFLQGDFVDRLHWLTERQLLDAVAIGQFTPGPVFTTATFVGYVVGGWQGALIATLAIFLPSFVYVGAIHPLATRLRRSPITATLLDGLNVAALALMAAVSLQLGRNALIDPLTILLGIAAFTLLLRFKPNSAWLIIGGALIG